METCIVKLNDQTTTLLECGNIPHALQTILDNHSSTLKSLEPGITSDDVLYGYFVVEAPKGCNLRNIADEFRAANGVEDAYIRPPDPPARNS